MMITTITLYVKSLADFSTIADEKNCLITQAKREGNHYFVTVEGGYMSIAAMLNASIQANLLH